MTEKELEILFPIGSIIDLKGGNHISAKAGAKAEVKGYKSYGGKCLVRVKWIRDKLSGTQQDGGYYLQYFIREESTIVNLKDFPHKCPYCNSPAYIGLSYIECSKKCQ